MEIEPRKQLKYNLVKSLKIEQNWKFLLSAKDLENVRSAIKQSPWDLRKHKNTPAPKFFAMSITNTHNFKLGSYS